jgi:hypothetical protein
MNRATTDDTVQAHFSTPAPLVSDLEAFITDLERSITAAEQLLKVAEALWLEARELDGAASALSAMLRSALRGHSDRSIRTALVTSVFGRVAQATLDDADERGGDRAAKEA